VLSDDCAALSARLRQLAHRVGTDDVAFTGHSNGSASEQFPFFWRPHTGGDHDPREIVTAFDDQCEGGMSRLGRCRIVKVRDEASESEYH